MKIGGMAMAIDLKKIYQEHKQEILKLYHADQAPDKPEMEKAYVDSNGVTYYQFQNYQQIPPDRLGKMQDFMSLMSLAIDNSELKKLFDLVRNEAALAYAGKPHELAKVLGMVLSEVDDRSQMLMHPRLLWNFIAVQYVREDENPAVFNQIIHDQKFEQFQKDHENMSTYFFFQTKALKQVNSFLNFTQTEWDQYWKQSLNRIEQTQRIINHLSGSLSSTSRSTTAKVK